MKKFAALFPGQGSQSVSMGKELYENYSEVRELFNQADEILGYKLSKLCFDGPIEELTLTENAQPALLVTAYSAFVAAKLEPTCAAGHSLGEYTALVAAGVLDFADAVRLVNNRGRYMQQAVPKGQGGMIAVLGVQEDKLSLQIESVSSDESIVEVANYNCPGQIVVAGNTKGIAALTEALKEIGAKAIPLPVSAPFHCKLMQSAAEKLSLDLARVRFNEPRFPVYANVTAEKIKSADEARKLLCEQVCSSVQWTQSMKNIIAEEGIEAVIEFGPGGVLTKLLKRIEAGISRFEVYNLETQNAIGNHIR